jgi:hypothetical protein
MLQIATLRNKPVFNVPDVTGITNGTPIIDLTAASLSFFNPLSVVSTAVTPSEMEMRPDLMALTYFGDDSKLDYICKFNGISNPFSLNGGDIVLIGDPTEFAATFISAPSTDQDSASTTTQDLRTSFFDPNRLTKKDAARLAYLQKKALSTSAPSTSNLPPNFSAPGATEIQVANGKIVFGGQVIATNKNNCPTTLTRAAVKAKLLQNKIFAEPTNSKIPSPNTSTPS